jgi:predicted nucleic acid-binding Zn ribbon protein
MSKRRDDDKWGPHAHCVVCGSAMPEGEKTCSPECAKHYQDEVKRYKRQQRNTFILIGGFVAAMLIILLITQVFLH